MPPAKRLAVFVGQGAQTEGMAARFLANASFTRAVAGCSAAYRRATGGTHIDIAECMQHCRDVDQTRIGQPLLASLQIGLAAACEEAGHAFDVALGHSLGEIAAAVACGVLTVDEAMGLAYYRARMLDKARGEMAVVMTSPQQAYDTLREHGLGETVSVAAANSARSTSISGADLAEARRLFKSQRVVAKAIPVQYAFHSPLVTPADVSSLEDDLRTHVFTSPSTRPGPSACTFLPTGLLSEDELCSGDASAVYKKLLPSFDGRSAAYWAQQTRNPVAFDVALAHVAREHGADVVASEIGPKPVLLSFIKPLFNEVRSVDDLISSA
ncbi:hypothetical protein DIPPA_33109 [Diplonema papillatum]|nr:hypothetical protein DIPPA_33109 [Diplonema papillatum]|eukprot:gene17171-26352_t